MLQRGRDHRIARPDVCPPPAVGDQVDRLGRAAGQHDLVRVAADEPRDVVARGVVGLGRRLGQRWTPRWTLPAWWVNTRTTASITARGLSEVEALSR